MGGESQRVSVFSESWDQIRGWSNCASIITPRIQPTLYHHTREQRAPVCLSHRISMEFWIILLIIFPNRPMISKSFLVYIIIGYLLEFSSKNCLMYTLIGLVFGLLSCLIEICPEEHILHSTSFDHFILINHTFFYFSIFSFLYSAKF